MPKRRPHVLPSLTVCFEICTASEHRGNSGFHPSLQRLPAQLAKEIVLERLTAVDTAALYRTHFKPLKMYSYQKKAGSGFLAVLFGGYGML